MFLFINLLVQWSLYKEAKILSFFNVKIRSTKAKLVKINFIWYWFHITLFSGLELSILSLLLLIVFSFADNSEEIRWKQIYTFALMLSDVSDCHWFIIFWINLHHSLCLLNQTNDHTYRGLSKVAEFYFTFFFWCNDNWFLFCQSHSRGACIMQGRN